MAKRWPAPYGFSIHTLTITSPAGAMTGARFTETIIYQVVVHAYVLMGNHFHMIVETPRANLSEFMRHFNITQR